MPPQLPPGVQPVAKQGFLETIVNSARPWVSTAAHVAAAYFPANYLYQYPGFLPGVTYTAAQTVLSYFPPAPQVLNRLIGTASYGVHAVPYAAGLVGAAVPYLMAGAGAYLGIMALHFIPQLFKQGLNPFKAIYEAYKSTNDLLFGWTSIFSGEKTEEKKEEKAAGPKYVNRPQGMMQVA